MNKHTPGPWIGAGPSFGENLPRFISVIETDRENEDDIVEICLLPANEYDEENEANALLISAAPDLLEAAIAVCDGIEFLDNYPPDHPYKKLQIAITKATVDHP